MFFAVVYFLLRLVLRFAPEGEDRDREAEILVLRHQLKVLSRKAGRPKLRRLDRVLLAAFSRLLPRDRWSAFGLASDAASLAQGTSAEEVDVQEERRRSPTDRRQDPRPHPGDG
jgi:hypothetical protein